MSSEGYLLGIDGGNTKTDFVLADSSGNLVDWLHVGTCSHEQLPGGYDEAAKILDSWIGLLCEDNHISRSDIVAAVMGLAGIDTSEQLLAMIQSTRCLSLPNLVLMNDVFPAIKAATSDGCGICSSCGTGVVTGGIDNKGNVLQVGGIGHAVGDRAGGMFLASEALDAVYAERMRNGPVTSMTAPIMEILCVSKNEQFIDTISDKFYKKNIPPAIFVRILFSEADRGDPVALDIVKRAAHNMADSVIGCYRNLVFDTHVDIIMTGTVWTMAETPKLSQIFKSRILDYINIKHCFLNFVLPPVSGAICWAMQLYKGRQIEPVLRENICRQFIDRKGRLVHETKAAVLKQKR
jgi:N-acetylglucosamine kinase-like BadF-type ATPase